jgi:dihydroorotase
VTGAAAGEVRAPVLVLRGGRVLDPVSGEDRVRDVCVVEGRIAAAVPEPGKGPPAHVVECAGLVIAPAFTDPHVHFREPGDGRSESIASGLRAAERGGYGCVLAMANTEPPNDAATITSLMLASARASGSAVRLVPVSAATRGLAGREPVDLAEQRAAGAGAVSDDGKPVVEDAVMERVLLRAADLGLPVLSHCETPSLHPGGVAHDGAPARARGLKGIPAESEAAMVRRDVALAARLGVPVHICHLSTAAAVEAVRDGKARGVRVTAEAAPHHLVLTDEALLDAWDGEGADPHLKMNPPLRAREDREAVVAALLDGTVDCIATDHAPHHVGKKRGCGFEAAAFGIIGLENAFAALHDSLVVTGKVPLRTLLRRMGPDAARVAGVDGGGLSVGARAALVLLDTEARAQVVAAGFASLSRNCPFDGRVLVGRVAGSVLGDRLARFP